jgi:hypothetical protein
MSPVAQSVQCLTTDWKSGIRSPTVVEDIFLTPASRPAVGPTQPPVQWVSGAIYPGVKRGRGVILITHPLLVPRLRKGRSCTSCHPNAPLWRITGPLYLCCNVLGFISPGTSLRTQLMSDVSSNHNAIQYVTRKYLNNNNNF